MRARAQTAQGALADQGSSLPPFSRRPKPSPLRPRWSFRSARPAS